MKQPDLDRLRESLHSNDSLDIVNAFMVKDRVDEPMPSNYWEHRICCLAEIIVSELSASKVNAEYFGKRYSKSYARRRAVEKERDEARALLKRALAIITDAIMHGMPITEEVAAVRNEIVGAKAT